MVTPRNGAALRRTATATAVAVTSLALIAVAVPAPEPLGIGDRLFPHLGNPGYDVLTYDISLRYSGDNTDDLQARTRIKAEATGDALDTFNLDFSEGRVHSVRVNGGAAESVQAGEDIVVTPAEPVAAGSTFTVDIRHTSPTEGDKPTGWIRTRDGLVLANQADAAHRVFPGNDHPSDKALFTFRITAPQEYTAVTSGRPVIRTVRGKNRTWTYRTAQPMATELAQVAIGRSTVVHRDGPRGLPLRDVVPSRHRDKLEPWLARTPRQLEWMEQQVGDYPFETYGVLAAEADFGFALETQTLSLYSLDFFTNPGYPDWYRESIMVHELAHHWFGNSVSPRRWSDLWLNEGHATWYEWRYAEEVGGLAMERRVKAAYQASDEWRRRYGPPAALKAPQSDDRISIFQPIVYDGSAVVLFALRQRIGATAFDKLQREWVERHRDGVAGTADFVDLANEVSGQDLTSFLHEWLHGSTTPPMPGRPDWAAGGTGPSAAPGGPSGGAAAPGGPAGARELEDAAARAAGERRTGE
ncbi:M1 family metallopeptidase [Streptomyces sp. 549]|uniref:M1 family metallopeptidase n=1 Tax=Streptomyces sp. 549 TaxID=3049076 RepID=UPI0024C2C5E4|nr:M1 family metallopeptidase [Streptomyces sp. 549]MDK1476449.1 M1 family metallopeptidase [Streptomyces sp. 549]